jgi:hypothetical protein
MIQDPYAFLSPTGGDERLSAFSSWGAFGYTLTVGLGLVDKLLLDPAARWETNNKRQAAGSYKTKLKSKHKKRVSDVFDNRLTSLKKVEDAVIYAEFNKYPAEEINNRWDKLEKGRVGINRMRANISNRISQDKQGIRSLRSSRTALASSIKGQYAGIGSFLRGTSAIMGMSMLMEAGIDIFTPGVNKLAEKKEAKFMMESLTMDTGAAFTQRQRAMQAIYDSQSQVQHVIGNEAAYLHG